MIRTFKNLGTEHIFNGKNTKASRRTCPQKLWRIAVRKIRPASFCQSTRSIKNTAWKSTRGQHREIADLVLREELKNADL